MTTETKSTKPAKVAKIGKRRKSKVPALQIAPPAPSVPQSTATVPAASTKKVSVPKPVHPQLKYEDLLNFGMPEELALPLFKSVTTQRGGTSVGEANFAAWLLSHCIRMAELRMVDASGNMHFVVLTPQGNEPTTLFVAHTDTVHGGGTTNKVGFDGERIHGVDEPLGADDGAGIAILCYLMHCKVPGRYIFTRQEESGGIGSSFIADNYEGVLRKYSRAIAFDRRGDSEVITVQGGTRCASEAFGEALSDALNERGLLYMPSDKGVYTDTKEFRHEIPECVNVACGYEREHGSYENLDLAHFTMLAGAAATIDWEMLPTARDPKSKSDAFDYSNLFGRSDHSWDSRHSVLSSFEEAVIDWHWGRKYALHSMLLEHFATEHSVDTETAKSFLRFDKLNAKLLDDLDYTKSDNTLIAKLLGVIAVI